MQFYNDLGQNVILGFFGSKCNFVEKPGSKYGYWKVLSQKAIFEEDRGQNMILGFLGLKHDFWKFWD